MYQYFPLNPGILASPSTSTHSESFSFLVYNVSTITELIKLFPKLSIHNDLHNSNGSLANYQSE